MKKLTILICLTIAFFSSFSQSQIPNVPGDPDKPEGCYFKGPAPTGGQLKDQSIPCVFPEFMRQVQPASLCSSVLANKSQFGCCPICWIVIDPNNFTLFINYLQNIYWQRQMILLPATPLGKMLAAYNLYGSNTWAIFSSSTHEIKIYNGKPSIVQIFDSSSGLPKAWGIESSSVETITIDQLEYLALTTWSNIPLNPCNGW